MNSEDRDEPTAAELCIVVPTLNERNNILPLVRELSEVLSNIEWEVIFVDDDSKDGSSKVVRDIGCKRSRIRCIQRIGRRGLSSAAVEGMLGSCAPYMAVMDGDLQHDPSIIPAMLDLLRQADTELVVGSRYMAGGSAGSWSRTRAVISRFATRLGHAVVPGTLRDPMSGFFMLRRTLLDEIVHHLSRFGFKILLDIFASARRPIVFREVPFVFRARYSGESKLDSQVVWEYLMLLADKLVGRYIPIRFVAFATIGTLGVCLHLLIVIAAYRVVGTDFVTAQMVGTVLTMMFNYTLNNMLTYRDKRRHGLKWLTGLSSFLVACSIGMVANIGVAVYLFNRQSEWILAAIAGVLTGAVWNYAVTSVYTWGRPNQA